MSWHEGEGKAARIRVPPAVAYTKGRYTLGAVGQESAVKTSVASKMPSRVSAAASVGAERCPPGTSAPRRGVLRASGTRPGPTEPAGETLASLVLIKRLTRVRGGCTPGNSRGLHPWQVAPWGGELRSRLCE